MAYQPFGPRAADKIQWIFPGLPFTQQLFLWTPSSKYGLKSTSFFLSTYSTLKNVHQIDLEREDWHLALIHIMLCIVELTGLVEHMGTVGICPHLFLACALTLILSSGGTDHGNGSPIDWSLLTNSPQPIRSPWTDGPKNLVLMDKWSPTNFNPIFLDPHSLSPWTNKIF